MGDLVSGDNYNINMDSKRKIIGNFRKKLQESGADSTYSNQFLYDSLMEQGKWLIKREISSGSIYRNTHFFQTLSCQKVVEDDDKCCPVKTNCKMYRTKSKLPETWIDNNGPIIKSITSIDNTTDFFIVSSGDWQNKRNDPYEKMMSNKYTFFADGYWWFPVNPNRVNLYGFYKDDISRLNDCTPVKECIRFLDTKFIVPEWLHSEMYSKALQQLSFTKQLVEDEDINKNPNRKN